MMRAVLTAAVLAVAVGGVFCGKDMVIPLEVELADVKVVLKGTDDFVTKFNEALGIVKLKEDADVTFVTVYVKGNKEAASAGKPDQAAEDSEPSVELATAAWKEKIKAASPSEPLDNDQCKGKGEMFICWRIKDASVRLEVRSGSLALDRAPPHPLPTSTCRARWAMTSAANCLVRRVRGERALSPAHTGRRRCQGQDAGAEVQVGVERWVDVRPASFGRDQERLPRGDEGGQGGR